MIDFEYIIDWTRKFCELTERLSGKPVSFEKIYNWCLYSIDKGMDFKQWTSSKLYRWLVTDEQGCEQIITKESDLLDNMKIIIRFTWPELKIENF